ncbi:hypothetical protein [Staphylococcus aureus]|uniref:hypothetical protein n=1 Tax=Staphylococcus aureus TaxID=1280 RepID=UPI0013655E85|nr:hypothetical protein [Staphylococcus aureus]QHK46546.1 hypothetical protein E3T17_14345 [Staphylococcus aureus]
MKSEALFESKKEIVMDEKTGRAVIVNKADDKDSKQSLLNESNSPIEDVRRTYTRDHVIQRGDVNLNQEKLKKHFEKENKSDDLKVLNNVKIDYGAINRNFDSMKAEVSLFAESFAQGVLSLFNIEVDKAVERYEERLHLMENKDYENQKVDFNISHLRNGRKKVVSPNYSNSDKAKERLNDFNRQQDIKQQKKYIKQEKEQDLKLSQEMEKEEEK